MDEPQPLSELSDDGDSFSPRRRRNLRDRNFRATRPSAASNSTMARGHRGGGGSHSHSHSKRPRLSGNANNEAATQNSASWQESKSSMIERIRHSLNSPELSDIIFLCGQSKTRIYAHKTLLCFCSPVFQAQFFGSLRSTGSTEEVPDIEASVFLNFLSFLYCDAFDENIGVQELLDLLYPAKKYLVPSLSRRCCDQLIEKLNSENIFAVYQGASLYDENKLKKSCIKFMERMSAQIIQTEEFTNIDLKMLSIFLALDGLNTSEHDLHRAALRWANSECARREVEPIKATIREILGPAIYLIRFPTMSSSEFSNEYPESVLTLEESLALYRQICSEPRWEPEFGHFSKQKRKFEPVTHTVNRFVNQTIEVHQVTFRNETLYGFRIDFRTDKRIFMNGVSLFAIQKTVAANNPSLGFEIDVSVATRGKSVDRRLTVTGDLITAASVISGSSSHSTPQYFPVLLDEPLEVTPKDKVVVYATVKKLDSFKTTLNTYYGTTGFFHVPTNKITHYCPDDDTDVVFNFTNRDSELGVYTMGQIPEILFSL